MTSLKPSRTGAEASASHTLYIRGLNAVIEQEYDHAIQLLSRTVELDSEIPDAYYHLGKLYIKQGDILRGQKLFRDLLLRSDLDREFREGVENSLISAYISGKSFAHAQKLAQYRVEKYPDNSHAR